MKLNKPGIGVIGANARAVAESAKRAGFETYLVDYFSDIDTLKSTGHVFSMQKNPLMPNFRQEYSREKLADFAIEKLKGKVEDVLLASSIGSDYGMIEKLENIFKILGNDSGKVKKARDWRIIKKTFDEFKIKYPGTLIVDSFTGLKNLIKNSNFDYPVIVKPSIEKEFQIKMASDKFQLNNFLYETLEKFKINDKKLHGKILIQEFIDGIPVSASILSDGKNPVTISINRQLIGVCELNSPGRFTYCGHATPADLTPDIKREISEISNKIISSIGLVGSVGIDFVISGDEIYFMEINPRFQDTLESVEKYRNINLVEKHLEALNGNLDTKLLKSSGNHPEKYLAKGILFADKKIKIGNLNIIPCIHDIPREGTVINEGEPVCTISVFGKNEPEALKNLFKNAGLIKDEFIR